MDHLIDGYLKNLEEYAGTFGVENKEDFELEKNFRVYYKCR
jgi:hypothetical protein